MAKVVLRLLTKKHEAGDKSSNLVTSSHQGLFTYYVSQKWGGPHTPSPMSAENQKFGNNLSVCEVRKKEKNTVKKTRVKMCHIQ